MTEHTPADQVIAAEQADTLIQWEVYVSAQVAAAVAEATASLGFTAAALAAAHEAVVRVIGEAAAAALRVGQAIAAHAYALSTGRRRRRGRRPARRPRTGRGRERGGTDVPARVTEAITTGAARIDQGADPQQAVDETTTSLQRIGTTAVNQAATVGAEQVAAQAGAPGLVWVAERDACVHCLGLAGQVSTTGVFDGTVTFGDKPLAWAGFSGLPPRHPHCRCRVVPWAGEDDLVALALRREAQRSVVRGWSLPTESNAARLRAAERLLRQGTVLPRSVERYGRDAVRAGGFPRGRTPPTSTGQAA